MKNILIIGNSAAAIGAVEGIRSADNTAEITIISDESYFTYSRPLISYLIEGKTDRERMKYRPDSFYDDNNCRTVFGEKAVKIDTVKKTVTTDKGNIYHYDKLLAATGSRAFIPPVKGLDAVKNKFTFMSLDDALQIEKKINKNSRVFILGAGLIGLKCAEAVIKKAGSVTVADIADRILPSILDGDGAEIVKRHIENEGVRFLLGAAVTEFSDGKAVFAGGNTEEFDILVVASGVRPNTELVKEAGGEVGKGIITDEYCQTSINDVYAAGDCAQSVDCITGEKKILALLPNAYMQGYCAGKNMAGLQTKYDKAFAFNAIGFFGLHMVTAGIYEGDVYEKKDGNFKKLFYAEDRLKGFIIIGDIQRAGIYTALIRNKTPLGSIDFELIKENPQLMAFTKAERQKILGEVRI